MWYSEDLGIINHPQPVTINGTKYPRTIFVHWSNAELAAIDIYPLHIQNYNTKFYDISNPTYTKVSDHYELSYTQTARNLSELKEDMKQETLANFSGFIGIYRSVSRMLDELSSYGVGTLPQDILDFKQDVYSTFAQRFLDIDAATTVAQLETLDSTLIDIPLLTNVDDDLITIIKTVGNASNVT